MRSATAMTCWKQNMRPWAVALTLIGFILMVDNGEAATESRARRKGKRVLRRAVRAIGGEDALMNLRLLEIKSTGEAWFGYEGESPEDIVEASLYERTTTFDLDEEKLRVDEVQTPLFEGLKFLNQNNFTRVIEDNIGGISGKPPIFMSPPFSPVPGTLPSESVSALKRQQMFFNPHFILKKALKDMDIVSYSGKKGSRYEILTIKDQVWDIKLFVDRSSGFISKLDTKESHPLIRDTKVVVQYSGWNLQSKGIVFPKKVTLRGAPHKAKLWEEIRTSVTVDADISPSFFSLPEEVDPSLFNPDAYEFGLQSHHVQEGYVEIGFLYPYSLPYQNIPLAPGVNFLLATYANSMAIQHAAGVIVLEAFGCGTQSHVLLDAIYDLVPAETKVTHIVQSHFHVDHSGGAREFVATTGAKLVVGPGQKEFWEHDVFGARSKVRPDTVEKLGKFTPDIEELPGMGKIVLIGDGTEQDDPIVTVYHSDNDPHVEDALLTMIQSDGQAFVFVADVYSPTSPFDLFPGGSEAFFEEMREFHIIDENCKSDIPLTLVGAHGFIATLDEAIAELKDLGLDIGCP